MSLPPVTLHAVDPRSDDWRARSDRAHELLSRLLAHPPAVHLSPSCTHALEAAATALDVGPGDEVVVPAYSFPSTANPFVLRGARVRFADSDPHTGNVTPDEVERCLGPQTRAVVCTHYGGAACDLDAITALCESHGADLIEDAAHGLFASYRGRPLGRHGRFGAFSFHRTKNISCVDGGALVVNSPGDLADVDVVLDKGTNRRAFESGEVPAYEWVAPGSSWRLSDPLAALLYEELCDADERQERRHEVWDRYRDELTSWADRTGALLARPPAAAAHSAHLFWVVLPEQVDRSTFVARCAERGVEVARHFGSLPHSGFGRSIADPADACPISLRLDRQLVRLPLHHALGDDEVTRVIEAVTSGTAA